MNNKTGLPKTCGECKFFKVAPQMVRYAKGFFPETDGLVEFAGKCTADAHIVLMYFKDGHRERNPFWGCRAFVPSLTLIADSEVLFNTEGQRAP